MVKIILDQEANKTIIKGTDIEILAGLSTLIETAAGVLDTTTLELLKTLTDAQHYAKAASSGDIDTMIRMLGEI